MKKFGLAVVAGAIGITATTTNANLVVNAGFEDVVSAIGYCNHGAGVTLSSDAGSRSWAGLLAAPINPDFAAFGQNVTTFSLDKSYWVSFYAKGTGRLPLVVSTFDGAATFDALHASHPLYSVITYAVPSNRTTPTFQSGSGYSVLFDDVRGGKLPGEGAIVVAVLLILPLGASAVRILRRNRPDAIAVGQPDRFELCGTRAHDDDRGRAAAAVCGEHPPYSAQAPHGVTVEQNGFAIFHTEQAGSQNRPDSFLHGSYSVRV